MKPTPKQQALLDKYNWQPVVNFDAETGYPFWLNEDDDIYVILEADLENEDFDWIVARQPVLPISVDQWKWDWAEGERGRITHYKIVESVPAKSVPTQSAPAKPVQVQVDMKVMQSVSSVLKGVLRDMESDYSSAKRAITELKNVVKTLSFTENDVSLEGAYSNLYSFKKDMNKIAEQQRVIKRSLGNPVKP